MAYQTLVTFSDISMVKLENNTTVQLKPKIYRRYVNMFSRRKVNTAGNCMFKVNNKDTRTKPVASTVNFEHVTAGWEYEWYFSTHHRIKSKKFLNPRLICVDGI